MLVAVFLLKIMAGIAYFRFYSLPANRAGSDTWKFYEQSLPETKLLIRDPIHFFGDLLVNHYNSTGGLFADQQSYWNDLKDAIMIKLMAIVNVFTGSDYYCNIIFFNFIFFIGIVALYRLVKGWFPGTTSLYMVLAAAIPSFLFWCSGIHKDGLIFSALALMFYTADAILRKRKVLPNTILLVLMWALVFFLRSYMALLILPCLAAAFLVHRFPARVSWVMSGFVVMGLLFVFVGPMVSPRLNIAGYLSNKQSQFLQLQGNSRWEVRRLEPDARGLLQNLPQAIDAALLRPHINDRGLMSKLASAEMIFCGLAFVVAFWRARAVRWPAVMVSVVFFSVLVLLVIGYTIPFAGAVVRYRSLVLPFLLLPVGAAAATTRITKKYI